MESKRSIGRRTVLGCAGMALLAGLALAAGSAGQLDPAFDGDGVATLSTGARAWYQAAATQSDGRIVVVGRDSTSNDLDPAPIPGWKVRRYDTDGALDGTFGGNGVVTLFGTDEDWRVDQPLDVAMGPGERVDIVGRVWSAVSSKGKGKKGGSSQLVGRATTVCLDADGALETAFGGTGIVQQDFADNTGGPIAGSILVDDEDRVVVGGFASMPYLVEVAARGKNKTQIREQLVERGFLLRYLPNGDLDATFGDGGVVIDEDVVGGDVLRRERMLGGTLCLQSDGKLLAALWSDGGSIDNRSHVVRRYAQDGSRDALFTVISEPGTHVVYALAVDPHDRIVVGMNDYPAPYAYMAGLVARYLPDGAVDTTFGDLGYRALQRDTPGDTLLSRLAVTAYDEIRIAAAQAGDVIERTGDALVIGLDAYGDLDAAYGTSGSGELLLPGDGASWFESPDDLILDAGGNAVVVGMKREVVGGTLGAVSEAWIARWCGP